MQNGHITYERCDDPEIQKIKNRTFFLFKKLRRAVQELIDETDKLLYTLTKWRQKDKENIVLPVIHRDSRDGMKQACPLLLDPELVSG